MQSGFNVTLIRTAHPSIHPDSYAHKLIVRSMVNALDAFRNGSEHVCKAHAIVIGKFFPD